MTAVVCDEAVCEEEGGGKDVCSGIRRAAAVVDSGLRWTKPTATHTSADEVRKGKLCERKMARRSGVRVHFHACPRVEVDFCRPNVQVQ
jgi:hypothetical protein